MVEGRAFKVEDYFTTEVTRWSRVRLPPGPLFRRLDKFIRGMYGNPLKLQILRENKVEIPYKISSKNYTYV
jgi:hypothetical protein